MREDTKKRKNASKAFRVATGEDWMMDSIFRVISKGKEAFDQIYKEIGKMMAETILLLDREEESGPDYLPRDPHLKKWASQQGSVYIGDQKIQLQVPRLRHTYQGEIPLKTYTQMKQPGQFSEELYQKALRGISAKKYHETVLSTAEAFGVSASSVSRKIVDATTQKLKEFMERDFSGLLPFCIFLDSIHRGGEAFIVALGMDGQGKKIPLGFWQGNTENSEICNALLNDLERRNLSLGSQMLWITDGGSGIIKSLKNRFGKKLVHQRCTIHKDRNIQKHLSKQYRKEAHERYRTALQQESYEDAKKMLQDFEKWLRQKNESAAQSLREALEDLLTLHRLKVSPLLRKTLHSTNPIESMFATVRHCEKNIKRYQGSKMLHRWLASTLIYCEENFRTIKGYQDIENVIKRIEQEQEWNNNLSIKMEKAS